MKKIITLLAFGALALGATAQSSVHVMQRGETIESIARKYGTTTEELFRLNPDAKTFVYVGMKLNVPEKKASDNPAAHTQQTTNSNLYIPQTTTSPIAWQYLEAGYEYSHLALRDGLSRNFSGGKVGYHIAFNITQNVPALKVETGLNLAFAVSNNTQYNVLNRPLHVDYKHLYLQLPLLLAYDIKVSDAFSLVPTFGAYMRCSLMGKSNTYTNDEKVHQALSYYNLKEGVEDRFDKSRYTPWHRFGAGLSLGLNAMVGDHFLIGASYSYELTNLTSDVATSTAVNEASALRHNVNAKVAYVF